jgi:hypothetical protein
VTRTSLDNPICSARVAWRHEYRIQKVKIVPNPFGGVNTHLWRNEAYIVGIVPIEYLTYIQKRSIEKNDQKEEQWFKKIDAILLITRNFKQLCILRRRYF